MGYHYDWTLRSYHENAKSIMPYELQRLGEIFALPSLLLEDQQQQEQQQNERQEQPMKTKDLSYYATACIVNYYNGKSVMGGHQDDLEEAIDKPIVSISLGDRPAIFILGQTTKLRGPVVPIVVRPGDVMIMGGQCRLAYHSMARLLPTSLLSKSTQQQDVKETCPQLCYPENACHQVRDNQEQALSYSQIGVEDIFSSDNESERKQQLTRINDDDEAALQLFLSRHRININLRQVY